MEARFVCRRRQLPQRFSQPVGIICSCKNWRDRYCIACAFCESWTSVAVSRLRFPPRSVPCLLLAPSAGMSGLSHTHILQKFFQPLTQLGQFPSALPAGLLAPFWIRLPETPKHTSAFRYTQGAVISFIVAKNFCILHNGVEHNYISPSITLGLQHTCFDPICGPSSGCDLTFGAATWRWPTYRAETCSCIPTVLTYLLTYSMEQGPSWEAS